MKKFVIDKDDTSLLVVDIQDRLAAAMKMKGSVIANTIHLIELAKMLDVPIIITEQYPKGLGPTVSEVIDVLPAYHPIEKLSFSCCGEPNFMDLLKLQNRKTVILTGMETHICVLQTCIDLLREGLFVHLARDAVCSRTKANWRAGVEFMRDAGAIITSTETVLFQALKVAGTEAFKTISKRIR